MKQRGLKFLSLLLMLVLLIGVLPGMTAFAETLAWLSFDTTVTYDTSTKILTVSGTGTGAMADYASASQVPWSQYRRSVQSVVIHDGVTSIGANAFREFSNMPSVSIPSSVTSIGDFAFYKCTGLDGKNLNIPGSVTSIGIYAFNRVNFTSVTFEPGVNGKKLTIGGGAFYNYNNSTRLAYGSGNAKLYYENGNEVLEQTLMSTLSEKTLTWKSTGFTVTLSGGANATTSGGATIQTGLTGAMTTVTYTANNGYTFPAFSNSTTNGITLTRVSDTVVTVSGTPTANVNITVPDATAVPTFTVTYIANNGTGETKVYTPAVGQTHNVEGQLFPAPQDKEFNNWLGDDGNTYLQGAQINTNRTLTAQWKDKSQGGGSHHGSGSGGGFDLVFNIPGADNSWEYAPGYAPQQAYRVSLAPMQGGSAALGLTTGDSGTQMNVYPSTTVYVFPNAEQGYTLDKIVWSLIDGSASYDITEAKNFVMPAMDVVVYVTFRPLG